MSSSQLTTIEGHPGLYRKPNGKVVVRAKDERGKVRDRTFNSLTLAVRAKGKIDSGERRVDSRISFARYAPTWLDSYAGRTCNGIDEETRESYSYAIRKLAMPWFKNMRLERIDAPTLRDYIKHLNDQGFAASSVRRYFAPLRALLGTAYEDGLLAANPAVGFRVVATGGSPRAGRPKNLTPEQTLKLLAQIPARHGDLALMYATTGARLSEPMPLRWRDLGRDSDGRPMVAFPRSKTEAGLTPIPLVPEMAQALTRRRMEQGAGEDDLVFPSERGTQMDARNWRRRVFKPAAKRAGVEWATPHMLRHGVATLMAERGYQAADIARILRHADGGRLAQKVYIHPAAPDVSVLSELAHQ